MSMIYSYFSIVIYESLFLCIEVRWLCYFRDNFLSSTKKNQMFLGNVKIIDISSTVTSNSSLKSASSRYLLFASFSSRLYFSIKFCDFINQKHSSHPLKV